MRGQTSFTNTIDFYIKVARDPARTDAERSAYWSRTIRPLIGELRSTVANIGEFVEETKLFSVVLSPEERLALADTLRHVRHFGVT